MNPGQIFISLFVVMCFIFMFPVISGFLAPFITIGQSQDSGGLFKWLLTMFPVLLFLGGIVMIMVKGK